MCVLVLLFNIIVKKAKNFARSTFLPMPYYIYYYYTHIVCSVQYVDSSRGEQMAGNGSASERESEEGETLTQGRRLYSEDTGESIV